MAEIKDFTEKLLELARLLKEVNLPATPEIATTLVFAAGQIDSLQAQNEELRKSAASNFVAFGWFEPFRPEPGGSLVERFERGSVKPDFWTQHAFPLYREK